jgi:hypothetical protein
MLYDIKKVYKLTFDWIFVKRFPTQGYPGASRRLGYQVKAKIAEITSLKGLGRKDV